MKKLLLLIGLVVFLTPMVVSAETSSLSKCEGTHNTLKWKNCFGTKVYPNGNKYVGEWKNGIAHGQGTKTWGIGTKGSGDKYVGDFVSWERNGQGTYTWTNGNKYVGEWKDGYKHGQGTHTWTNGAEYTGEWQDNKMHGQGTHISASGTKYVGEWKEGNKLTWKEEKKLTKSWKDVRPLKLDLRIWNDKARAKQEECLNRSTEKSKQKCLKGVENYVNALTDQENLGVGSSNFQPTQRQAEA